jgi:hypothetical protein
MKFLSKAFVFLFPFLAIFLSSCETDVDVIAPYQEKMVVYGLLNQTDTIQLIKINKTFLGNGDALQMAKVPDSLNYNPQDLEVYLEELNAAGNVIRKIPLKDTLIAGGTEGIFSKEENIHYYTFEVLNKSNVYVLTAKNKKSGYFVTSRTPLIDVVAFRLLANEISFKTDETTYSDFRPQYSTGKNGRDYQLTIRFHYKEFVSGNDTVYKFLDWSQPVWSAPNLNGTEVRAETIKGEDFFKYLQSRKSVAFASNDVNRLPSNIEMFVTAGGEELSIYSEISKPSSTVIYQERPFYTNVQNGLGIFSCRYESAHAFRPLNFRSKLELAGGQYTKDLNFQ